MTTQHQAPEVTSELRECPFCGSDRLKEGFVRVSGDCRWNTIECDNCGCSIEGATHSLCRAMWNTRATQPLSLTVDEGWLRACLYELLYEHDASCGHLDITNTAEKIAPLLLDRLQSLSLPVDIDRSGLAQEVE